MAGVMRLNKVLRELNISLDRAVEFLDSKGIEIEARPTTKISSEVYGVLSGEFQTDASKKVASKEVAVEKQKEKEALRAAREDEPETKPVTATAPATGQEVVKAKATLSGPKQVGKIDLDKKGKAPKAKKEEPKKEEAPVVKAKKDVAPEKPAKKVVKAKPASAKAKQEKPAEAKKPEVKKGKELSLIHI